MNDELAELYSSKWDTLLAKASELSVNAANPLLIKVDQKYVESDVKVMVVGQETDGWHKRLNDGKLSVERLMENYSKYFNQESPGGKKRGTRAFWNRKNYRYFEEKLSEYFESKQVSFVWNNISKIGNAGKGKPRKSIKSLERESFNAFLSEFKILQPDIVIFTTGSSRDSYIRHHFGKGVIFESQLSLHDGAAADETLNLIAEVKLPQFHDVKAIRIEHPGRRTLSNAISLQVLKNLLEKDK